MVDADEGVVHPVDQQQGGVACQELCLVQETRSLVQPQLERIISRAKILLSHKFIWRERKVQQIIQCGAGYRSEASLSLAT